MTDPFSPRPWHNYLFNDEYLVNLTQFGTGASFWQSTGEGLRTNITEDRDGNGGPRFVFLRDNDNGRHWNLAGAGETRKPAGWKCRVGPGYQVMESRQRGVHAQWRVFVHPHEPAELWTLTVRNPGKKARHLSVFPYLEMHLTGGSTLMDFIAVLGGRYEPDSRAVFGINSCVKFPPRFKAFLASDCQVAAATVSRDAFLGPYRSYLNPVAVERGDLHNPDAGTEWLGASLRHDIELAPGESWTCHCAVGAIEALDEGRERIARLLAPGAVEKAFTAVGAATEAVLGHTTVETGDRQFDRWTNVWLKHQLRFVGRWGRVIGRGFRDILQDVFGHRLTEPGHARKCLLEVLSKQYADGRCIRAWRLPNAELDLQDYADSPSWIIMALAYYLKETGDFDILGETVPYLNAADPYAAPVESGTVLEHAVRAQRHLLGDLGRHGLSKIHYGDWCDTMNGVGAGGEGESVMLTMQVKWGCDLFAELAGHIDRESLAQEMREASAHLRASLQEHAWAGDWFLRAFDDDGIPVGAPEPPPSDNGEGRIFLNPQSWALISGCADAGQAESAIAAAQKYLNTGYGMTLNWPAFTGLKPRIGQMTAMTPGFYENGSVYVHGNCFWIHALAVGGRGAEAWEAFRAILPDTPNKPNTDTEPFAVPNYYIGPDVERRAQRNLYLSGWRTGSAAWLHMTAIEGILGARAEYDGLRIDPRLPGGWKSCRIRRNFRGAVYDIRLRSSGVPDAKVKSVRMDGKIVRGNLLPLADPGRTARVSVTLA